MKKIKRLGFLITALCATCALAFATACTDDPPLDPEPTTGDETYIFPADDDPIVYGSPLSGDGTPFIKYDAAGSKIALGRYECEEGYYEIDHPGNNKEVFYSFRVYEAGQYALYTMESVSESDGIVITQYDASAQYIPTDENGKYVGNEAELVPNRNVLYSRINCSEKIYNSNWRATYGITSSIAKKFRVRFVRIADAIPDPENIETKVTAKELVGKLTGEETANKAPVEVPYSSNIFFDENATLNVTTLDTQETKTVKGFYRMGTAENPGEIVYAAITSTPSRLFADNSFSAIQYEGNNLVLYMSTNADGNYLINNYIDFIMNDGGEKTAEKDTTKLCYQNVVNADGMYPVNQELYEFLCAYVRKNPPALDDDELVEYADKLWLAPCYYYDYVKLGTKSYPHSIDFGTDDTMIQKDVETVEDEIVYYNVKWNKATDELTNIATTSGYYTVTCSTANAYILYGSQIYKVNEGETLSLTIASDVANGATFGVAYFNDNGTSDFDDDVTAGTVSLTIEKTAQTLTGLSSPITLITRTFVDEYGEKTYRGIYEYKLVTTNGNGAKLDFVLTDVNENATVTVNGTAIENNELKDLAVSENATIVIEIEGKASGETAKLTVTVTENDPEEEE